jgi:hypothetical protein
MELAVGEVDAVADLVEGVVDEGKLLTAEGQGDGPRRVLAGHR